MKVLQAGRLAESQCTSPSSNTLPLMLSNAAARSVCILAANQMFNVAGVPGSTRQVLTAQSDNHEHAHVVDAV